MPQRRQRELVFVLARAKPNGQTINYGFNTSLTGTDGADLGHSNTSSLGDGVLVTLANLPKPARFTKKQATGTTSSFCGSDAYGTARAGGWRQSKAPRYIGPGKSAKTTRVYVTLNGNVNYIWNMYTVDFEAFGSDLGIKVVDNDTVGVMGASLPKPGRASRVVSGEGTDNQRTQGSFFEPTANLPEGWRRDSEAQYYVG